MQIKLQRFEAFDVLYANAENKQPDIKSAAGNYLIPDIGVANIGTMLKSPRGDIQYKNYVRPYYGLNISFVPINKNVDMRELRHQRGYHKAAHYFSFTIGLTAVALNRPGASDLLKSSSLITGLGIRPYKWVRFTIGDMLYQANNYNPVKNPVPAFAPFISFSIDADLFYAVQTLISKIYP